MVVVFRLIYCVNDVLIDFLRRLKSTDRLHGKTPCLGAHSRSLKKTLVAQTHNLGAPGARAPIRQQPCCTVLYSALLYSTLLCCTVLYSLLLDYTLSYATLPYSMLRYSTARYFMLCCSTLLYSTLRY